ncbi:MAG: FG-GAP-like repeat-containing protein [Myxococcota bacterium]
MRLVVLALIAPFACHHGEPPPGPPASRTLEGPLVGRALAVAGGQLWVSAPGVDGAGGIYAFGATGGALADAARSLEATEPGELGGAFAPCDVDGDGALDLLAGGPDRGDRGGAWWLAGPVGAAATADATFVDGLRREGHAGALVGCGDLDGDGIADAIVGAPDTDSGGVAVRTGTLDLYRASGDKFANVDTTWTDSHLGYRTGVAAADLDGDGIGDLAAGAAGVDRVHLVFGPVQGSVFTNQAGPTLSGPAGDGTGHALAAGDVDGDGQVDLVVGAPHGDAEQGGVWIVPGPFDPAGLDTPLSRLGTRISGVAAGDQAGFSVAVPGDLDGDGADDVLVGAPFAGGVGAEAGAAYVVYRPAELQGDLDSAAALLLGDVALGRLGWAVAGGDLDGDGAPELAVSAPEADYDGVGVGAVFVFDGDGGGVVYPDAARARIDR